MKKLLSLLALALLLPTMALALPFVPTTSPNTLPIHWYYLKTGNKYVYASPDPTGMADSDIYVSSSTTNSDSYLWCFVGNSTSGYRIYNRATQSYLYAGPFMGEFDPFDYFEAGSGNNFYIYCNFTVFGTSTIIKNYLCYSNSNGFYTTMGKDSYFTVAEAFVEEPQEVTLEPIILLDIYDTYCEVKAYGDGTVKLYVNGSNVENPYSIQRTDEDQIINVTATAQEPGKEMSSVTRQFTIPKLENPGPGPDPEPVELTLTPTEAYTPHNDADQSIEGYDKMFDKSKSTKWCIVNSSGSWETIWVDFKSNVAFIPDKYIFTTGNDTYYFTGRNPKKWKIYAKVKENDQWTTIVEVNDGAAAGLGTSSTTDYSFDIANDNKYQYFRFEVSEIRGKDGWNPDNYVFQLAEFQFVAKAQGSSGIKGDLDGNGIVDVEDVNAAINIILKLKSISDYSGDGDMDSNGIIDVEDVNALINIILKL